MRTIDRVLLYTVAFLFGGTLILGLPDDDHEPPHRPEQGRFPENSISRTGFSSPLSPRSQRGGLGETDPLGAERHSLVLVDRQGRPRIELRVGDDGHPQIALKNETGQAILSLHSDIEDAGKLVIGTEQNRIDLHVRHNGELGVDLARGDEVGAYLNVRASGEAELGIRERHGETEAVLQTTEHGVTEVAVRSRKDRAEASLSLFPSGALGVRLGRGEGAPAVVMQLFEDGLAEVAITGPDQQGGPNLMRLPDGVSVISARLPSGNPGASLVTAPDGKSVIAVSSSDGNRQAALRVSADGTPEAVVIDPVRPAAESRLRNRP